MIVGASTWLDKEIGDEKYEIDCFSYLSKNKKVGVQSYEIR